MSDWKESSNKRREVRHTKDSDEHRKESSIKRKNTKRWCKGKVGKEHTTVCMTYAEAKLPKEERNVTRSGVGKASKYFERYRFLVCTNCGKELEVYYGLKSHQKPDWVTK